jgi:hypothetical protein
MKGHALYASTTPGRIALTSGRRFAPPAPAGRAQGPSAPEDAEAQTFLRHQSERTHLDTLGGRAALGSEREERLRFLAAEMDGFWSRRLERADRLGHHFGEPPARGPAEPAPATGAHPGESAPAVAAGEPIQRVLNVDRNRLPAALRDSLAGSTASFNDYGDRNRNSQKALHAQFRMLDGIERAVHHHLRDNSATTSDQERQELFGLLRQTQTHHVDLTARTVRHGRSLWLRDGISKKESKKARALWRSLVGGTGNVSIQTANAGFRSQTLSGFAHLLQGAHGRGLLGELNQPQGGNADRAVVISDDHAGNYTPHGKTADPGSWAAPIADVRHNQDLHTVRAHGPNTGTGSFVQIASAPPATLDEHESDAHGRAIFAPDFITLGHELGHARHNLRGTTERTGWFDGHPLQGQELERRLWTNPEEHANIQGEENPIRAEHEMPQRQHHATIGSGRATRHRFGFQADLDRLWATVPARHRGALGRASFGPLHRAVDQTDLSQPHLAQGLRTQVDQLGRDLPGTLWRKDFELAGSTIRAALKPTKKKALGLAGLGLLGGLAWWNRSQGAQ